MAQIPERVTSFRCYTGAAMNEFLGMTDVELPGLEAMTEKITGAGIAGEIDSIVLGHYGSQTIKLKWRVLPKAAWALNDSSIQHVVAVYGAIQNQDPALGALITSQLRVEVRGQCKTFKPGKLEPGKVMDGEVEIECVKIAISVDGVPVFVLDKVNFVCEVNGVDILRPTRVALGGV